MSPLITAAEGTAREYGLVKQIVVLTGQSGAGRSVATGALEDLGWYVIDNLPSALIPDVAEIIDNRYERLALSLPGYEPGTVEQVLALKGGVADVTVVFLESSSDVLIRRYESTKRRHPFAVERRLSEAIRFEREQLVDVRSLADLVVDTSNLNPHELRERIGHYFSSGDDDAMQVTVLSFGFKHGLPRDVDMVIDCRFLPNPYWVPELRSGSGLDDPVRQYVLGQPIAEQFLNHLQGLVEHLLPAYEAEGKSYFAIAFGCTGGRHRSVAIAEELAASLAAGGRKPRVAHRDIEHV